MKFNKWTVALAAVGVVSLASVAKAEEKAGSVMTALSSTTLSGYVDTSAQWNFGTGNANLPPYKFGGAGKADGFNLDVIQVRLDKPLDESQWAAGYRVDLWFGPDAKTLGTDSYIRQLNLASDFAIRQAYVALRMPVGNGIDWKIGVFDSIIGYESVESGSNPNYTRSYGHSIEPQTMTGVLASYRFSDMVSASFGVANTMGPSINSRANSMPIGFNILGVNPTIDVGGNQAESFKTYMGSIALTAPDSMGFLAGSTLYAGIVSGFSPGLFDGGNATSYYVGATVATPVTGLRLGLSFDNLDVHGVSGETWSIAGYASYQATEKLSFHARGEFLKDRGDQEVFQLSPETMALTATVQYDLWKNVLSRLELRWDHSLNDQKVFSGNMSDGTPIGTIGGITIPPSVANLGVPPTRDNAWMLAANIVYKF